MIKLNFYERAILHELLKQSESGILNRSYRQIANEIEGITYISIRNYLERFANYGIVSISNKGTSRQYYTFNLNSIKKLLG